MNKRHYEHTLPNIRGSLSNTYDKSGLRVAFVLLITVLLHHLYFYTLLVLFTAFRNALAGLNAGIL